MAPVTNQILNAQREKECVGITAERKYFHVGDTWIKRSVRPSEWPTSPFAGMLCVPRFGNERVPNEGAAMRFVVNQTDIPVSRLLRGRRGRLPGDARKVVEAELERHLETLRSLKSDVWGGPSGILLHSLLTVPPYRVMVKSVRTQWKMKSRENKDLVSCHNDLSTHNVIVDPETLKVKAIIDWEYAGFFPMEFGGMFFRRPVPSVALEGEVNDEGTLLDIMDENKEK